MDSSRKKMLHILIASCLLIALLLLIFPELYGLGLLQVSWQYFFYEFVFFGIVSVVLFRAQSLLSVVKVAVAAICCRLAISATFGVVVTALYSMDFQVAMKLALISYLPGVALQILLVPAAFWPILKPLGQTVRQQSEVIGRESSFESAGDNPRAPFHGTISRERASFAGTLQSKNETFQPEALPMHPRSKSDANQVTVTGDLNGFERTVRYIAEHGSVQYASIVDSEGLLLANHCRGKIDPEDLAPLAVMFFDWNRAVLAKGKLGQAEKIDITLKEKRLILGRVDAWCLMVLSERQADDLLNIRINQGMDILRKFTAERYASRQQTQVEKAYV